MKDNYQPIEVMRKLFDKDYENKVCVECKSPMPSYVSINNAILLCNNCAARHMKLGYNVSYIRHLSSDWDAYLFAYLDRGGNSRFIRLSKKYDLDQMPIEQKFNTRILEYYRLLVSNENKYNIFLYIQIKSEVLADAPPFEIPYEYAKNPIENQIIYFPEFENYQIFEGNFVPESKKEGLKNAFRFVGSGLGSMATYFGEKYQEYDMNNKIIEGGAATLKGIAAAGKLLYKISKPIVKYASIRAIQGVGYLCKQVEDQITKEDKDDGESENEDEKKNNNKKHKKKKVNKKKEIKTNNDNSFNNNNNSINNQGNNNIIQDGDFYFEPCVDYPTFESINRISDDNKNGQNNNFNPNQNNNNYSNQINNNYSNQINNNYSNQNNNNYTNQNNNYFPNQNAINNQVMKPDFVIPVGLESSSHENSIIGEK